MPLLTPNTAFVALGANLGDREANIRRAVELLGETAGVAVVQVSTLIENPAVGGPADSPAFLNGMAKVDTTLDPRTLLDRLLHIEKELGRERRDRWEPRPIDLDLILYGEKTVDDDGLTVPHPRMHEREFVLKPLAEIAPGATHPTTGKTAEQMLADLAAVAEQLAVEPEDDRDDESEGEGDDDRPRPETVEDPKVWQREQQISGLARLAGVRRPKPGPVIVRTIAACRAARAKLRRKRLAFVPTMGALHEGHLLCMQLASEHAPSIAVSIFVNPTQFGPREDFTKYPRPIEEDVEKCRQAGVDLIFMPSAEEMYPEGSPDISVDLPSLTGILEGKHRPGHFKGVCQVVAKLFHIVQPNVAVFGQKDFQQYRVLTAMTEALNWPIEIVRCPTLREPDGLAMSSRNAYLSPEDRVRALALYRALTAAETEFNAGHKQTNRLMTTMQKVLLEQHLNVDYVAAVDPLTLKNVDVADQPTVLAVAARVGNTRLIDNIIVGA
jgi:pantoate--beta-alanine ligase